MILKLAQINLNQPHPFRKKSFRELPNETIKSDILILSAQGINLSRKSACRCFFLLFFLSFQQAPY